MKPATRDPECSERPFPIKPSWRQSLGALSLSLKGYRVCLGGFPEANSFSVGDGVHQEHNGSTVFIRQGEQWINWRRHYANNGADYLNNYTWSSYFYKVAPTSLAHASVLKDFGRSIGAPTARSMINWGRTPMARETPKRTV